jgi:hypothetical protein
MARLHRTGRSCCPQHFPFHSVTDADLAAIRICCSFFAHSRGRTDVEGGKEAFAAQGPDDGYPKNASCPNTHFSGKKTAVAVIGFVWRFASRHEKQNSSLVVKAGHVS